ncbi:Bicaudal D-related protein 1 [Oryzias melastigma]|uniref:Bicaudal D-related protein 1 n=1 Tax=Oryzias melastigma TaxID=30732 RepID=A0A834BL74_ORYME|nr:Bicaudal D-related protein 1 [Oryzias melastigma]
MDYSQPFSVLNEKLRPSFTFSEQLYSSLNRLEDRRMNSFRGKSTSSQSTILTGDEEPKQSMTEPETLKDQEDLVCSGQEEELEEEEETQGDFISFVDPRLFSNMNLTNVDEQVDDSSAAESEAKEDSENLSTTETEGSSKPEGGKDVEGSSLEGCYIDGSLPDLIKSGRPLGRRRTVGHAMDTLKEVRREVELSRKRSIRLKAQVDKLQEKRDGHGWSQHREAVTEEVLSILRLLHPLADPESKEPEPSDNENQLNAALGQLKNVARKLAFSHTKQEHHSGSDGADERAILQQALRDRDEAIEKKKAMEGEVLRSKTEMMTLNNHLLEAAQKRLELSLELEAWKEDFQRLLQQQLQTQQQFEQAQKKSSRLGILRRTNKPPIQRPTNFPLPAAAPPTTNQGQIFITKPAGSASPPSSNMPTNGNRTWRDKLKKGKSSRYGDQDAANLDSMWKKDNGNDGFQVVSLD